MSETQAISRRRWFRFGLRSMFVVLTVVSLWLGWQAKIVRERKEALEGQRWDFALWDRDDGFHIPFWRRWLGDQAVRSIHINASDDHPQFIMLQRKFPEALIYGTFTSSRLEYAARAEAAKRMKVEPATLFVQEAVFQMNTWIVAVSAPDGRQAILRYAPSGEFEKYTAVP